MNIPSLPAAASLLIACLLTACVVGPDFHSPEPVGSDRYSNELPAAQHESAELPRLVASDSIPEEWWQIFKSAELVRLVRQGLENSPTLAAARARLEASQETLNADTGYVLYPSVDAGLDAARKKISGAAFGNPGNGSIFSIYNASINISYAIDFFGGSSRYLEYGQALVDYDALQLQAARITLASNIVTAAISEASLREQVAATEAIIAAEAGQLEITEKQFELGAIPKAELLSQRTTLAQTRAALPALHKALAQTRHLLATLTGSLPGEAELPEFSLGDFSHPEEIPLTLPSRLTRQRPDVRAAEAVLHQASAQVGIATANLYPNIKLSGSYATEATRLGDLFSAGSSVWGLGAGLVQPLFHGGELQARKRAAIADFNQAAASYRQSVLDAFKDVADALLALETDSIRLQLEQQSEQLATETLALVQEQHRQGAVSYLELLHARRQYQQSRLGVIQAEAALYADTAALMYALGSGWQGHDAEEQPAGTEKQL